MILKTTVTGNMKRKAHVAFVTLELISSVMECVAIGRYFLPQDNVFVLLS